MAKPQAFGLISPMELINQLELVREQVQPSWRLMARCTAVRGIPVWALSPRRLSRGLRSSASLTLRRAVKVTQWGRRWCCRLCTLPVPSNVSGHRIMARAGGTPSLPPSWARALRARVADPSSDRKCTARIRIDRTNQNYEGIPCIGFQQTKRSRRFRCVG